MATKLTNHTIGDTHSAIVSLMGGPRTEPMPEMKGLNSLTKWGRDRLVKAFLGERAYVTSRPARAGRVAWVSVNLADESSDLVIHILGRGATFSVAFQEACAACGLLSMQ